MHEIVALPGGYAVRYFEALENATPEERSAAAAQFAGTPAPEVLDVSNDGREASITITGVLTPEGPSALARFFGFGGTSYRDIVDAAALLQDDPTIETVRLKMDTPGGLAKGMDQARQALEQLAASKTLIAENHGQLSSAGYYLATAAPQIVATSPLNVTGSIGVKVVGIDPTQAMERAGLKKFAIVSENAPNKNVDPATESGRATIKAEVDAVERVFLQKVAGGRGTTVEDVKQNFGRGAELIARDPDPEAPDALSVGMIDAVVDAGSTAAGTDTEGATAGPTTFRDFPLADRPWDAAAAVQRVRRFLGATEAPNTRYRQAFFWYDSENSDNFGAYKLPFVDVVDGRLVAIVNGINAANGAMGGARGNRVQIPDADRPRVQAHIDRYREKWNRSKQQGATGGGLASPKVQQQEGTTMDLKQLQTEHPAVFAEAVALGKTQGTQQERERVDAHLTMGEACGDLSLAVGFIREGAELTSLATAKYQAKSMGRHEQQERAAESEGEHDAAASGGNDDDALARATAEALGVDFNG